MTCEIAIMSSVHSPDDIRVALKEGRSLVDAGFDVCYFAPERRDARQVEGLKTTLIPVSRHRVARMFKTCFLVFWGALLSKARICHFHDPELIPYGIILKLLGRKIIYDVHEDVPKQILAKHWIPRYLRKPIAKCAEIVETVASSIFDGIVAATPSIARKFPAHKTVTIQNYPLQSEIMVSQPHEDFKVKSLVYVGGISENRGLFTMLEAIRLINRTEAVALHLAGRFTPATLEKEAQKHAGWNYVVWHGWLDRASTIRVMRSAQVGLLVLDATPNHLESLPIKLFEYMASGLPVVASSFPLWERIINSVGCGVLVDPHDSEEIARKILWLIEHPQEAQQMGARGKVEIEAEFNWNTESAKLLLLYSKLVRQAEQGE